MLESLFSIFKQTDLFALLSNLNTTLAGGAEALGIAPWIFYIAGMVVCAVIGVFGYKMIKLLTGVIAAVIGYYFVGAELCYLIYDWFSYVLPAVAAQAIAIAFGVLFFFLAFAKFTYTYYTAMGIVGFVMTYFYTHSIMLSLGVGFLVALLCMFVFRLSFILLSSLAGGFVGMSLLSAILPEVAILKIGMDNLIGIAIAAGVSLLFIILQFVITRKSAGATAKDVEVGARRVKKSKKNKGEMITVGKTRVRRRRLVRDL